MFKLKWQNTGPSILDILTTKANTAYSYLKVCSTGLSVLDIQTTKANTAYSYLKVCSHLNPCHYIYWLKNCSDNNKPTLPIFYIWKSLFQTLYQLFSYNGTLTTFTMKANRLGQMGCAERMEESCLTKIKKLRMVFFILLPPVCSVSHAQPRRRGNWLPPWMLLSAGELHTCPTGYHLHVFHVARLSPRRECTLAGCVLKTGDTGMCEVRALKSLLYRESVLKFGYHW